MHGFHVTFRSFEDVRDFVSLASAQSFEVTVHSGGNHADGKSLMVMLGLDYSHPLWVQCSCGEEQARAFAENAARFRA